MNVLVLSGGDSPERAVSLRSGKAISDALKISGVTVTDYDPISGQEKLIKLARKSDIVFPILHGLNGEDGSIQELLESMEVRYLGSNSASSKLCFDKELTHKVLDENGILMPEYKIVTMDDIDQPIFKKPFVLKPKNGGSSLDTLVVREISKDVINKTKKLLGEYDSMIAEELIEGIEITIAVLGTEILPVIAIIPPNEGEFDYENKYNGHSREICPVPEKMIPLNLQIEAEKIALRVHKLLKARHLSRTDMIIDKKGIIHVLELNTMPGMTNQSLFPIAASAVGLSMENLVQKLANIVIGD